MNKRRHTKLVREGLYAAEVEIELIETDDGWSPYLSLDDAYKLDNVREACGGEISRQRPVLATCSASPRFCHELSGEQVARSSLR